MKGDFSRIRYNPARQYTSVLKQQGRVDLDSDANEQRFIDESLRDIINTDVIGPYGGPEDNAGFAIQISGNDILIGPGRYYVDGILVENPATVPYDQQPWLLQPSSAAQELLNQLLKGGQQGSLSFVLEVWQRMVTAIDDPCLLEPALNQADTTTRLQTVWRVIGSYVSGPQGRTSATDSAPATNITAAQSTDPLSNAIDRLSPCCQLLYRNRILFLTRGEMGAELAKGGTDCGCQPIAAAGYQGLENQLYRIEIHHGGNLASATFKWSRENASVVTQVTDIGTNSAVITVASLGPDANLGFQPGQWVELSDDTFQFGDTPNQPGQLFQIKSVNQGALQVTLDHSVNGINISRRPTMRRWDQAGASATSSGIPVSAAPIPLENGIEVCFRAGDFQPGDYWTIPARTANGQIDWPPCGKGRSLFQQPDFMKIHRAPIACAQLRARVSDIFMKGISGTAEASTLVNDCRLLFPPLTAVNADLVPAALHVQSVSWTNDDVMTVDSLVGNGLSVTFDQPTTCAWGGGNFQVSFEPPFTSSNDSAVLDRKLPGIPKSSFPYPAGTDSFLRTVMALDPPWGVIVSGNQVNWMTPFNYNGQANEAGYLVLIFLDELLKWQSPIGFARVRVRLIGGAVFGAGPSGNIYLDGQSFGDAATRAMDNSPSVSLAVPSGNSLKVSDYEGWFYLAPSVYVSSVVIQGVNNGQEITITALKVIVNSANQVIALQIGETATVTNLQARITLSYAPIAPVTVALSVTPVSGTNPTSVISIAPTVQIPAGQQTITTPITIIANPGGGNTDVVSLNASVMILQVTYSVASPPTLSIAGMTPPQGPVPPTPAPFPRPTPGKL